MSTAQLSPGTVVDGRYEVGAPGPVRSGARMYAAIDKQDGEPVVLTAYDSSCFSSGLVLERSLRELRQLQAVQSRRVASVLGCGKLPQGGTYEVNGALPPQRLDMLLALGPLPAADASALVAHVGGALLEAQKAGVIHRNLGPRVVFISDDEIVVGGFAVGEPHGDKSRGPLDTIAPEQIEGKVVDQRTLIYNLAALMHMMLTGSPVYPGDAATQLPQHLAGTLPDGVHARLRRALGRDPRMRPMMLKQFVAELRAIGGGAGPAPRAPSASGATAPPVLGGSGGSKDSPSSRGWTMFMKAEEGDAAPTAPSAPTAPDSGKPKTRGWTMFMEAEEGEAAPAKAAAPAPDPAKPKTRGWTMFMEAEDGAEGGGEAAAATPATPPAAEGSPRTRGWTMFMEEEEGAAGSEASETPEPAAASTEAAPPEAGTAAKPSTRGWTMFMKAEDSDEAQAAQGAPVVPSAVQVPSAAKAPAVPSAVQAPSAAKAPAVPSAVKAPSAAQAPVVPSAVKAPSVPSVASPSSPAGAAAGTGPKSRGWTMFTESVEDDPAAAAAAAAAAVPPSVDASVAPPAAAPEPAAPAAPTASAPTRREPEAEVPEPVVEPPTPAADPADDLAAAMPVPNRKVDADAPAKKRGWTMFMEKPLDDATPDALGGAAAEPGESNAKGWTVFSQAAGEPDEDADTAPSPAAELSRLEPEPEPVAPVSGQTVVPPSATAAGSTVVPEPRSSPAAAADGSPRSSTVVTGAPVDPAAPRARPKTMITPPGSGPGAVGMGPTPTGPVVDPATPLVPVPGAVSGPISGPVSGPLSGPVSGPISVPNAAALASTGSQSVVPAKKNNAVILAAVGVLVIAVIVAVIWMST